MCVEREIKERNWTTVQIILSLLLLLLFFFVQFSAVRNQNGRKKGKKLGKAHGNRIISPLTENAHPLSRKPINDPFFSLLSFECVLQNIYG